MAGSIATALDSGKLWHNTTHRRASLVVAMCFLAGALFGQAGEGPKPWYAEGLRKLGFTVFPKPQSLGEITLQGLDGGSVKLGDQKGKIVLLNFWATWCPPCRAEMPSMELLWKANKDKAFVIMGVSEGEKPETVRKFIGWGGYSYPIFVDPGYDLGSAFGVRAYPTTYVLDKAGDVIAGKVGGASYDNPEAIALFAQLATR